MINIDEITRQLNADAEAIQALLHTVSEEQGQWKPGAEIWSLKEVITHMYNEERIDFRKHLREMFSNPPAGWGTSRPEELTEVATCREALEGFLSERKDSIAWLKTLQSPDWDLQREAPWGRAISAGEVLVSWVEHDFLHLRQMIEVLYAWNAKEAAPYSVEYAGRW